ncbi:MAG TPA: hypothetical protein VKM54_22175 [Myxococcota bacterium]|nr:hypothetical protein [Myxococcota bacterium]
MPRIVLVHGIGHEHRSAQQAEALEATWRGHLAEGLRRGGYDGFAQELCRDERTPSGITVRLAFYGDCFRRPGQMGLVPDRFDATQLELAEHLARIWLTQGAERASDPRDRQLAARELSLLAGMIGQSQGPRSVVRSAVAGLAHLKFFARAGMALSERLVLRTLAQVTTYFTDEQVRTTALTRVKDLLGPETVALVGHSLGSVVAFEAAHQLEIPLPLMITLGSPLGLRTVIYDRLRPQPPTFPPQVRRWVNVADRDDLVAAEPNLTGLFGASAHPRAVFEGGWTVDNGSSPHDAGFYLARAETGRPVGQTLSQRRQF